MNDENEEGKEGNNVNVDVWENEKRRENRREGYNKWRKRKFKEWEGYYGRNRKWDYLRS